jgi:hypothetical protein
MLTSDAIAIWGRLRLGRFVHVEIIGDCPQARGWLSWFFMVNLVGLKA